MPGKKLPSMKTKRRSKKAKRTSYKGGKTIGQ